MYGLLCRNRVKDYAKWKRVVDSHTAAHRDAGLSCSGVWCDIQDQNTVFFLFKVGDLDRARAFISNPQAAAAGKEAGVLDGDYHFLELKEG